MSLKIGLRPRQWEVFHAKKGVDYDVRLYQGGVGSGKTYLGVLKGLAVCSQNHGCTWLVAADTYARLAITTVDTYKDILNQSGLKFSYNKMEHCLTLHDFGGARVLFRGIDNYDAIRSMNAIGAHVEEGGLLRESSYLAVLERLRQAGSDQPIEVIITTNPQPNKGWLYKHFVENAGVKEEIGRDGNIVKFSRRRVIARTLDNPHVTDAFIAGMKASYDDELYRIMVLGEDRDYTKGLVCYNFSAPNVEATTYKPESRLYLTCDFNIDPMCWAVAHRYNGEYHFIDELCLENCTTEQAIDEFYSRYGQHRAGLVITGDASGENRSTQARTALDTNYTIMRNRLGQLGMSGVSIDLPSFNPPVNDRTAAWNAKICSASGVRAIRIDPKCKWLIYNCENLKYIEGSSIIWEPTRRQIEQDNKLKFTKHIWDAASYLVHRYDPIQYNNPSDTAPKVVMSHYLPSRYGR